MNIVFLFSGQARTSPFSVNPSPKSVRILDSYNKFIFTEKFKSLYKYKIYISTCDLNLDITNEYFGDINVGNIHLFYKSYYKKNIVSPLIHIREYYKKYKDNPDWAEGYIIYLPQCIEQQYKILDCYNLFINDSENDINRKNCDFIIRMRLDTEFEMDLCDILDGFKENPKLEIAMCWDWGLIGKPEVMDMVCTGLDNNYGKFGYDIDISYIPEYFHEVYSWDKKRWKYAHERQMFEMIFTYFYERGIDMNDAIRISVPFHFVDIVRE
jgi:hypothetical protein